MSAYKLIQFFKELFGFCGCKGCHNRYNATVTFTAHLNNGKEKKIRHKLCMDCVMNGYILNKPNKNEVKKDA